MNVHSGWTQSFGKSQIWTQSQPNHVLSKSQSSHLQKDDNNSTCLTGSGEYHKVLNELSCTFTKVHGPLHLRNVKERKKKGNRTRNNFPIPKPTTVLNTYKARPFAWIPGLQNPSAWHLQGCPSPASLPQALLASSRLSSLSFSLSEWLLPLLT